MSDYPSEASSETLFEAILRNQTVQTLYQPIVQLNNGAILGYEALSRGPKGTALENPLHLLEEAEQRHQLWDLEILLRKLALERAQAMGPHQTLFINVDPRIIHDPKFQQGLTQEYLKPLNRTPGSIAFEITERFAITDHLGFSQTLNNYKHQGYQIAIDDAGSGYSGMHTIAVTQPGFVKIDMDIVRDIHLDPLRQAIVKSFVLLGTTAGIRIIAEGIETQDELKTLIQLGVYAGQGYFIGRPAQGIQPLSEDFLKVLENLNRIHTIQSQYNYNEHPIGNLAVELPGIDPDTPCGDLEHQFRTSRHEAFCIAKDGFVQGIITRNDLYRAMSSLHGHAVYAKRPVSLIMDTAPTTADYFESVQSVAQKTMTRTSEKMYNPVLILKGFKYYGIVSVRDILAYSIEYERDYARELNPLTQLPGNKIINRVLNDTLSYIDRAAVLYFDLDHFKAYNDVYGFEKGDRLLILVSKIIQEVVREHGGHRPFVGHIGGDDFVAVLEYFDPDHLGALCQTIMDRFDQEVVSCYSAKDLMNGYILTEDRMGRKTRYGITSISIAVCYGSLKPFETPDGLAEVMAAIKKQVKKMPGSAYQLIPAESYFNKGSMAYFILAGA